MFRQRTFDADRLIRTGSEQSGRAAAESERAGDHRLLDAAIAPMRLQCGRVLAGLEGSLPRGEVDGSAVVGIDQGEVPELGPLVEVRNAGGGEAEQGLGEAVDGAVP